MRMVFMPASPKNKAYIDHSHADSVPRLMSVSIVAVACLRLVHAARWNGQAPHRTTGVLIVSDNHCQLSNCSGEIIDIARTGTASSAQKINRCNNARVGSSSSAEPAV